MSKWHIRYRFPVSFETGPVEWFSPSFNDLFIRIGVYDELDEYLENIQGQHGKFWISGPLSGYGKSTMLNYIERELYCNLNRWCALPFHISVGRKTPAVEDTFFRDFISQFLKTAEKLAIAEQVLDLKLSSETKTHVMDWFAQTGKHEIRRIRKELATLTVKELERRFNLVAEEVLKRWSNLSLFSKYVLLIDEMDKLNTEDVLRFLAGSQDLFQKLYQELNFVVFISGHSSWVERILDGTEYTYYRGHVFRIPPFQTTLNIKQLVDAQLVQYMHLIPSDNPWTTDGYDELGEMSGGVPRFIIELSALAINEAQRRNLANIGRGILKEIIITEQNLKPIEDYFRKNPETLIKLRSALDRHVDSLLYIFYDMPEHRIAKDYDDNLANRTKYLGVELDDAAWNTSIRTLINLDCISDTPYSKDRELEKDIWDLFDKLKHHPALIQKVVPAVINRLRKFEPKLTPGKTKPPDFQQIIETSLRARAQQQWFNKKTLFEWFLNSTRIQLYVKANERARQDPEKFLEQIFEQEFSNFLGRMKSKLLVFEEENESYYRFLPAKMEEDEYLVLKIFKSRDLVDRFIGLVVIPRQFDSDVEKLDRLLEDILSVLAEQRSADSSRGFLRKKIRWKIFKELQLSLHTRRRLDFYVRESKGKSVSNEWVRQISRQVILDLANEYKDAKESIKAEAAKITELLGKEESETLEFKSSMCWDYNQGKRSTIVEFAIAKTVSSFMNSEGGRIVIGIGDRKEVLGIENDLSLIKKPDVDGFGLHFTGIINKCLGKKNRKYSKLLFKSYKGKTLVIVEVAKGPAPVFIEYEGTPRFYIRAGNSCQPLDVSEATSYIKERFK